MPKKPAGLSKKISSIFSGIPSLDEQVEKPPSRVKPSTSSTTGTLPSAIGIKNFMASLVPFANRAKLFFEIGSSKVKAVLFSYQSGDWVVDSASEYEFQVSEQGERVREEDLILDCIRTLAGQLDPLRKAQIGLAIAGPNTLVTSILTPNQPKKQWHDAIAWQLAESSLFPLEEAEIQWIPIRLNGGLEQISPRLLVSAVSGEELEKTIQLFKRAELDLEVVVPLPLAIDWLMLKYKKPLPPAMAVMDVGAENTRYYFFQNGALNYMRETSLGCDHILRSLIGIIQVDQERFQIGFDDAARLVREFRLLSSAQVLDPAQPKRSQLSARIRPVMDKLVGEIKRSFSYYQTEFQGGEVRELFLMGGGSNLEGLGEFLSIQLGIPVTKLDMINDFNFRSVGNLSDTAPTFKESFGPVLGLGVPRSYPINFADWRDRWHPYAQQAKKLVKLGSVAVVLLSVFNAFTLSFKKFYVQHELEKLERKLEAAGPQTRQLEQLGILTNAIQEKKARFDRAVRLEPIWTGVLRELSHLVPRDMLLEHLEVVDEKSAKHIILHGFVRDTTVAGDIVVSELLKALNGSPFFGSATLLSRSQEQLEENARAIFSVKAQLM